MLLELPKRNKHDFCCCDSATGVCLVKEDLITVQLADGVTRELIYMFLGCFCLQTFMFAASSSNATSTPTPEETMEADGNNSSGSLFAPPGKIYFVLLIHLLKKNTSLLNCKATKNGIRQFSPQPEVDNTLFLIL